MQEPASRIGFGLVLLVLLWIGVYWFWPAEQPAPISFADTRQTDSPATNSGSNDPLENPAATTPRINPPPLTGNRPTPPPQQPRGTTNTAPAAGDTSPSIAVVPPQFVDHVIEPGETFRTISVKYFGTSAHAAAIARANPFVSPTSLRPGRVVRVPIDPRNIQGLPVETQGDTPQGMTEYIVKRGDSLSKIASMVYGDSRLAEHIYLANRDTMSDMHSLRAGQKLRIPPKPSP